MKSTQITAAVSSLNMAQAKNYIENLAGLTVEKLHDLPFSVLYSVKNHAEFNSLSICLKDLTSNKIVVKYCFND